MRKSAYDKMVLRDLADVQGITKPNAKGEPSPDMDGVGYIELDEVSEEEAGEYYIDEADVPRAMEILAAYKDEMFQKEHEFDELYVDLEDELRDSEDEEFAFNLLMETPEGLDILDIQESMARCMKLINVANDEISKRFENLRWFGTLYKAWSGKLEDKAKAARFLNDPRNVKHIQWMDYRKRLWAKWHSLKAECQKIVDDTDTRLWPAYFALAEFEFNRYFTIGNITEDTDDKAIWSEHLDRWDDLAQDHIRQMRAEETFINKPIQPREEPFVHENRGCLTRHWVKGDKGNPLANKCAFEDMFPEDDGYLQALLSSDPVLVPWA